MQLWHADGLTVDQAVLEFTVGEDPVLDKELLPFDCIASAAHARVLEEMDLFEGDEFERISAALREAFAKSINGEIPIPIEQEDAHTALESFLVSKVGEAGLKIHTGRSRNDQVIQALRLLVRERLLELADRCSELVEELIEAHHLHHRTLMPGYTHTRQAMPSTVGQLFGAAAEGAIRDLETLALPLAKTNRAALGSASGYGVPLPMLRKRIPELLGLDSLDANTLFVQNTRGHLESSAIFSLHQMAITQSRFAADLILFSSEAFQFFQLPVAITTGSSIMPQKRNPDVLELIRALPASMLARYVEVTGTLHGLGSGYHRDLQRTKGPLLVALAEMARVLVLLRTTVREIEVNDSACEAALDPSIFATDHVYRMVLDGTPFRTAYQAVKKEPPASLEKRDILDGRTHVGAPGTDHSAAFRDLLSSVGSGLERFRRGAAEARLLVQ
ncbi:MAG: argininosuccinate lyase [Candidatus Eisenbacteria bacterium]|nr:argininosuccinate lyase [Candidatus Eisenbacteria bacterium]